MFVTRSRYESLEKECSDHLDEIAFLRDQLAKSEKQNELKEKKIDTLYSEAKSHAKGMSTLQSKLEEAKKDGQRLAQLKEDMKTLKFDLEEYMHPAPVEPEQRALYVARISGYFTGGLREYINYLLSSFKAEIARFPLTERETDFYRSGVNICYLLIEWGDSMIAEHHANARGDEATQDAFEHVEDESDDEAVENIKRSVNE